MESSLRITLPGKSGFSTDSFVDGGAPAAAAGADLHWIM